jgi:uncharacterized protein (DUF983 family)
VKRHIKTDNSELVEKRIIVPRRRVPEGYKYCPRCDTLKLEEEFPGTHGYCRICHSEYKIEQYRQKQKKAKEYPSE